MIIKENLDEELNDYNQKEKNEFVNLEQEKVYDDKEESKDEITCNMCNDPKCPREKGDLRKDCIHYDEVEK